MKHCYCCGRLETVYTYYVYGHSIPQELCVRCAKLYDSLHLITKVCTNENEADR